MERRPQHMEALDLANEIRTGQADLKRQMRRGELDWQEALIDPRAQRLEVRAFLRAKRGFGDQRVDRVLRELPLGATRRLRELTPRQRTQLLERLGELTPTNGKR